MILKDLFSDIDYSMVQGTDTGDVTGLSIDSRKVEEGNLFIAIKGRNSDGHDFVKTALGKGAAAVLLDEDRAGDFRHHEIGSDVTVLSVKDTRDVLSKISNSFYGNPARKFNLIGVTGTNGKTSVTVILNHILKKLGHKTGLIGTIANYCGDEVIEIDRTTPTTPDCIELAQMMTIMAERNIDDVIMEASSMGLKTKRVKDICFDIGVYTNISPEHLDDHVTMEDYRESKLLLFKQSQKTVVNMDDTYGQTIARIGCPCIKYGVDNKEACDLIAEDLSFSAEGVSFRMVYGSEHFKVSLTIPSKFAIYNVLAAAGACLQMGIPFKDIKDPIQDEIIIPGRYDIVQAPAGFTGIIDYAHTEVALDNLLQAVQANPAYSRIISVFGCGGDRDPSKREAMGKVSGDRADYTIITSDNPRTEDPTQIVNMVEAGIKRSQGEYEIIVDRKSAIEKAVKMAGKGSAIVIAGKGHETYQILKDRTIDFDDKKIFESLVLSVTESLTTGE